jgi:hypothetical protein
MIVEYLQQHAFGNTAKDLNEENIIPIFSKNIVLSPRIFMHTKEGGQGHKIIKFMPQIVLHEQINYLFFN